MRPFGSRGFTLVELISVMILIGILSVFALPRVFGHEFAERGLHDGVKAALQHARHVAVASRRFVCVSNQAAQGNAAANVSIALDQRVPEGNEATNIDCATSENGNGVSVPLPGRSAGGNCAINAVCAPEGVGLGGASVFFDPLGRSVDVNKAVVAAAATLTVSNQPDITVQPETGWVR